MRCHSITRLFLIFIALQALSGCAWLPLLQPVTPLLAVQDPAPVQRPGPLQVLENCRRLETDLTAPYRERHFSCRKPQSRLSVPLNMSFTPALRPGYQRGSSYGRTSPETRPTVRIITFSSERSTPDEFGVSVLQLTLSVAAQAKRIVIRGSTDNTGSINFNDALALRRAKHVFDRLVSHGIDQSKISLLGRDPSSNQRIVKVELFFL